MFQVAFLAIFVVAIILLLLTFRKFDRPWATFGLTSLGGAASAGLVFWAMTLLRKYSLFPFAAGRVPSPPNHEDWGALAAALFDLIAYFVLVPMLGGLAGYSAVLLGIASHRARVRRGSLSTPGDGGRPGSEPGGATGLSSTEP